VNAVYILWLRQLKRYFRSRARMIGSLGQPTLFLLALGFGLGPTFARADYVQFLAPGIVTQWASCSPRSSAASRPSGTANSAF
jgi:ABC-2 type transport system permease protein